MRQRRRARCDRQRARYGTRYGRRGDGSRRQCLAQRYRNTLRNIDAAEQTQRALTVATENPIGLALPALAIGFLTGSLLPATDVERERLGPIRDKVVEQARATTSDLVEAGKGVVAETAQSAMNSALSSAQTHNNDVVEAAKARNAQA
jgi:hypothetical protein